MIAPQIFSNPLQQAIVRGSGQINDVYRFRMTASASGAGGDDRNVAFLAPGDEETLGADRIDRVKHIRKTRGQDLLSATFSKELGERVNFALRVDRLNSGSHHFDLGFAEFSVQGMELAVHIAHANIIQIHQRDFPNTGTRQGFDRPGTHTTNPDDANMRGTKPLKSIFTHQACNSSKSLSITHSSRGNFFKLS
jgi:hypothetical protein